MSSGRLVYCSSRRFNESAALVNMARNRTHVIEGLVQVQPLYEMSCRLDEKELSQSTVSNPVFTRIELMYRK